MTDYKPYRILEEFTVIVHDSDDVLACYPHGKRGTRMLATGTVGIIFGVGVIDAATEEEIAVFSLPGLSKSVKPIPQDPRGFDDRASGVARSIEGSNRGREKAVIEKHERKSAKVKDKSDFSEPDPDPEPEAEPEIIAVAEPLIKDLEYLSPLAKKSLTEKNVLHIADLAGWTADRLDGLQGIGARSAERLLADHEEYLMSTAPVTDETNEEGDTDE